MERRSELEVRMPNLVFELVSPHLCPKILRPCRLVCKSWNDIACEILQKFPVSFVESSDEDRPERRNRRLWDFSDLLASRKKEISHPFRKISIKEISGLSGDDSVWVYILRLQKYEDIEVSNLEFESWTHRKESIELRNEIMTWSQDTLRSLSLYVKRPFCCHQFQWKLRNLEKLKINYWKRNNDPNQGSIKTFRRRNEFMEYPEEGSIKTFLESILLGPKLSKLSLTIEIDNFQVLKEILSVEKIRSISSLEIRNLNLVNKTEEENSEILHYFTQNPFPNVKNLSIIGELQSQFCFPLIGIFAQSLEILSYHHGRSQFRRDPPLALNLLPTCPQLRELNLTKTFQCAIDSSFSEKFPSLKRFSCQDGLKAQGEVRPHFGVKCLNVSVAPQEPYQYDEESCTYCKVEQHVLQHFPNVSYHDLDWCDQLCPTVQTLWTMVNYFPNVRALKIKHCGELLRYLTDILSSISYEDDVRQAGFEKVFRDLLPLQNFRKLNSLDLSESNMKLIPAFIRLCLGIGRIPTLRNLRLSGRGWSGSKSDHETLEALRECLQPLNELQLQYVHCLSKFYLFYKEVVPKLFPIVANVVCVGSIYCNSEDLDVCKRTCKCKNCKNDFPF